jgi:hypothetical protein
MSYPRATSYRRSCRSTRWRACADSWSEALCRPWAYRPSRVILRPPFRYRPYLHREVTA